MNNSPDNVSETLSFAVENGGLRLDVYVSQMCELTRSSASKLVENGKVTVDGKTVSAENYLIVN